MFTQDTPKIAQETPAAITVIIGDTRNNVASLSDFDNTSSNYRVKNISEETVQFEEMECEQSANQLRCNGYTLQPVTTAPMSLSDLNGTYKAVDSDSIIWSLQVTDGEIELSNAQNSCKASGIVSLAVEDSIPFFELTSENCTTNGDWFGYGLMESLYEEMDTIQVIVPGFETVSTNWTR